MEMIGGVRLDGVIFYFAAWTVWLISTFFLEKRQPYRLGISTWILLLIIATGHVIPIGNIHISYSAVLIIFTVYILIRKNKLKKLLYLLVCQFIMASAYVSFHLYEMFDPVWVVIAREWLLSAIMVILSIMLIKKRTERILLLVFASIHGELLNGIIFHSFSFPYTIGSFEYLDVLSMASGVILLWNGVEYATAYLGTYFNQLEKERGKTS
jgi:hypothetical protein